MPALTLETSKVTRGSHSQEQVCPTEPSAESYAQSQLKPPAAEEEVTSSSAQQPANEADGAASALVILVLAPCRHGCRA